MSDTTNDTIVTNMQDKIPGYPDATKTCGPSGRCSVISIQGFNRACSALDTPGTLQREVLLQL